MEDTTEAEQTTQQTDLYDMSNSVPVIHEFKKIIGNQLICTQHNSSDCPSITVSPTAVLEPDEKGVLQLVNKAVR